MSQSNATSIFFHLIKTPALFLGVICLGIVAYAHFIVLPTFLKPGYGTFWDDVRAYRIKADGHPTLDDLYARYDEQDIHDYVLRFSYYPGLIPSEKAALDWWMSLSLDRSDSPQMRRTEYLGAAVGWFPALYLPALLALTSLIRNYTWALSRGERAALLYAEVYHTPLKKRVAGALVAVPVVVGLALLNGAQDVSPATRRAGYTLFDFAIIHILMSYFAGLGVRAVQGAVHGLFIAAGRDPEHSFWDEIITAAITVPALVFLYDNSTLSVSADLVAGLAPAVGAKVLGWRARRRQARLLDAIPVRVEPLAALIRNITLALVIAALGVPLLCCGTCMTPTLTWQSQPRDVPIADIESGADVGNLAWVEVRDGYLFWPRLAKVESGRGRESVFERRVHYYVPLVSAKLRDEWLQIYRKDGDKAIYPFANCRVVVVMLPEEVERLSPGVTMLGADPAKPYTAAAVRGETTALSSADHKQMDAITRNTRDAVASNAKRLEKNSMPLRGTVGVVIAVLGVLALLPPAIRYRRGWPRDEGTVIPVVDSVIPVVEEVREPPVARRRPRRDP